MSDPILPVGALHADLVYEIPISLIGVSEEFNSRVLYERIPELAVSIKTQGQHTPVDVELIGDAAHPYRLISGHRRYLAIKSLWQDQTGPAPTIRAMVRKPKSEKEAFVLNVTENLGRDSLTTYEVARALVRLKEDYGMSAKDISALVNVSKGFSKSNINNMIRCIKQLDPKILKEWANGNPVCELLKLYDWASLTPNEQLDAFDAAAGTATRSDSSGATTESPKNKKPKLLRRDAVEEALACVREATKSGEIKPVIGEWVMATLAFVLQRKNAPSIKAGDVVAYDPRGEKENEETDVIEEQ